MPTPVPVDLQRTRSMVTQLRDSVPAPTRNIIEHTDFSTAQVVERGKDHRLLIVTPHVVVRLRRDLNNPVTDPVRVSKVVRELASQLPWELPVALSQPDVEGVIQPFISGGAHPHGSGDPQQLRKIATILKQTDMTGLPLAAPFAQRGSLTSEVMDGLAQLPHRVPDGITLPENFMKLVHQCAELTQKWTDNPVVEPTLVHGDLAGHNMVWRKDEHGQWWLNGILDWDYATAWDPAINVAYLCLWHGEHLTEQVAGDTFEAVRARVWLGTHALGSLYDALGWDISPAGWKKLLKKTLPRLHRTQEAMSRLP